MNNLKFCRLYAFLAFLLFAPNLINAQTLTGKVIDQRDGVTMPLVGATIIWKGASQGTATDKDGNFSIPRPDSTFSHLVVSYLGYLTDTVAVADKKQITINLKRSVTLGEVSVIGRTQSFSALTPTHSQVITARDLTKSACCNLAESFETNASVEVSTSDAVSGAKQIQMLGLDGAYSLMTVDNIPTLRGLATPYRLNYISGTWIDAIDIIKGTGSVINGYESISGQVNVRLREPEKAERLYFNVYGNSLAKFDGNLNLATALNKKLSTILMLHSDHIGNRVDGNNDGFMDLPLSTQYNVFNKWKYKAGAVVSEFGIGALQENRLGGQINYEKGDKRGINYGTEVDAKRFNAFSKTSYTFPGKPYQSVGLILANTHYNFNSLYGFRNYDGQQKTTEAKLLFQSAFGNTSHTYKTGLSYISDNYEEQFIDTTFSRRESVPGAFFEYVYQNSKNLTLVAGARADYHNLYGTIFTPRFNLKYDFNPNSIFRLAAGKGFRVANPIAENTAALVSSRRFKFNEPLNPEKAWNIGGSFTQYFTVGERSGTLVADYYYTTFQNQVIADMYSSPDAIYFTNLTGRSFSKSFQAEVQYEVAKGLDLKAAYKYFDVKSTYGGTLEAKPFSPQHRFFINAGFATPFDKWKIDFTTQWFGLRPVPSLEHHHNSTIKTNFSDRYFMLNSQVTRAFKRWEVYAGGENLLNYRQPNPIFNASNPFGPGFDASMVWGPTIGRVIYSGLRFKIN